MRERGDSTAMVSEHCMSCLPPGQGYRQGIASPAGIQWKLYIFRERSGDLWRGEEKREKITKCTNLEMAVVATRFVAGYVVVDGLKGFFSYRCLIRTLYKTTTAFKVFMHIFSKAHQEHPFFFLLYSGYVFAWCLWLLSYHSTSTVPSLLGRLTDLLSPRCICPSHTWWWLNFNVIFDTSQLRRYSISNGSSMLWLTMLKWFWTVRNSYFFLSFGFSRIICSLKTECEDLSLFSIISWRDTPVSVEVIVLTTRKHVSDITRCSSSSLENL